MNDQEIMSVALDEAKSAYDRGECPVGAVIVKNGKIIVQASNREIELKDPTAHAEILVLRKAGEILKKHTFPDCMVYTTLRPCPMCANSLLRAKVPKVVCGAESFNYIYVETFNPSNLTIEGPIMNDQCRDIFIKWVKKTNREFILSLENNDKTGKLARQRNPYLTADIIIEKDGSIVLVERKEPVPEMLALPGGFVEWGETVEEAAVREAREETGLAVKIKDILGVYSDPARDPRGHIATVVFVAQVAGGKLELSEEHSDVSWYKLNEIDFKNFHGDHAKILQDYLMWKRRKDTYWSTKKSINK